MNGFDARTAYFIAAQEGLRQRNNNSLDSQPHQPVKASSEGLNIPDGTLTWIMDRYPHNPSEPDYGPTDRMVRALLSDIIFPESVRKYLDATLGEESRASDRKLEEPVIRRNMLSVEQMALLERRREERVQEVVAENFGAITLEPQINEIREEATRLLDTYMKSTMRFSESMQAVHLRKALSLMDDIYRYVGDYRSHMNGVELTTLTGELQQIVQDLAIDLAKAEEIFRRRHPDEHTATVQIKLPHTEDFGWESSHQSITVIMDQDRQIAGIKLHEIIGKGKDASAKGLQERYLSGEKLTEAESEYLSRQNPNLQGHRSNSVLPTSFIGPEVDSTYMTPITLLGLNFPQGLLKRYPRLDRSQENLPYAQGEESVGRRGPLIVNLHTHTQNAVNEISATLDTRGMSTEDVYALIGYYIELTRAFPLVRENLSA